MIRQSGKILVITDDRAFLALLKKTTVAGAFFPNSRSTSSS